MTFSRYGKKIIIAGAMTVLSALVHAEIVVVVSAKSATAKLSQDQVADIFLGRRNRLPNGERVMPIDQAEGAALRDEFYLKLINKSPSQIKAHWSKLIFTGRGRPPKEVGSSQNVKRAVAVERGRIGYVELDALDASVKAVFILP